MDPLLTDFITFLVFCVVLFLGYRIILVIIKRIDDRKAGKTNSSRIVRILLRFAVIFSVFIGIFTIFNISSPLLVSLSSISGIIIGFASTEVVTQIIAGIYLITTRPFTVDDLVKIQNAEGLVIEINLNHTIIKQFDNTIVQIPNKSLLEAQILNYTMNIKNELKVNQSIIEEEEQINVEDVKRGFIDRKKISAMLGNLSEFITDEEITQYVFDLEFEFDQDPQKILANVAQTCSDYENIYDRTPRFKVVNFGYRVKIRFWVYATRPQTIMDNQNSFIQSIARNVYKEAEQ